MKRCSTLLIIREMWIRNTMRLSSHTNQNGDYQKIQEQEMWERVWREGNPPTLLVRMEIGAAAMEKSMEVPYK